MRTVTRFKRFTSATTVPGDAVYLTAERPGQTRLQGPMIERLTPLLAGKHTRAEIVAELAETYSAARVERALDTLTKAGHVVEVDAEVDAAAGGYWELFSVDGDSAVRSLAESKVEVVTVGDVRAEWFTGTAESFGISVGGHDDSVLTVVLTDDYLRPELADIGRESVKNGRPWLLVKPVGAALWVGPVFEPGVTACYECLRIRLSSKQLLTSYLKQRGVLSGPLINSITGVPATAELACRLAALHAAKWLTGAFAADRELRKTLPLGLPGQYKALDQGEIVTMDTLSLSQDFHPLERRPQCSVCGDPALQASRMAAPVELQSRPKARTADGGHRARNPQDFVDSYQKLVSPITGPISNLTKIPLDVEGLHTYTAGQNFAMPMANIADLRAGLRSASAGKGISDIQAKASALGEAIERYSGVFHGDEAKITASYNELGPDKAIHPNELHQYSDEQFARKAEWNARPSHFHWVTDQLDPDAKIEWSPLWSLSEQRTRYFPTSGLYFAYHNEESRFQAGANSNGCAAGTSLEDAILQGFMELVERDSVAMWWYNRLRMPGIDLSTFDDPYFQTWQDRYESLGRKTWVLDITNDLGIPSIVAVSYRVDKPAEDILFALGAHFDVKIAIGRALSEMNQFLPAVIGMNADGTGSYAYNDPDQLDWWQNATIAKHPYLLPADGPLKTAADYSDPTSGDLREDVRLAERIVRDKGMEMLVLDQTRVDIGLPVVRVMVPGMRHFWPRYAAGRLYDIPVELGWLDAPTPEADLNPIAMFL